MVMVALTAAAITYAVHSLFIRIEVQKIPTDALFSYDYGVGFNLNKDRLHFGRMPIGGSGTRYITLENTENFRIEIRISSEGEIREFFIAEPNPVVLEPGEIANVNLTVNAPSSASPGNYTGNVLIDVRRKLL